MWAFLKFYVTPLILILLTSGTIHILPILAKGESFTWSLIFKNMLGNAISWSWIGIILFWAIFSLKIPSKTINGPETVYGFKPVYKDNGFQYYCFTLMSYALVDMVFPLSETIFDNFPEILGSFNITAFCLCIFLLIKGKFFASHKEDMPENVTIFYNFYSGLELHPSLFGIDIKQLTNCRIGLMGWQIYIWAFFFTSLKRNGFSAGFLVNFFLQTIYIAKFFWWEAGYFHTLDMIMDRAGFYICWGCLVWVPCLYTFSSYYTANNQPAMDYFQVLTIFTLGLLSVFINYRIDYEKQIFRSSKNHLCKIWGKEASFIKAKYIDARGRKKTSPLLTSGFWGVARHMNYTFEMLAAFFWCSACGFNNAPMVHFYFIFLFVLLIHRTIRDEYKCSEKYGKYWNLYCQKVPYRLLPFVW